MNKKKTYKDFGLILEELKDDSEVSYEKMGITIGMNPSTLQRMAKIRAVKLPEYEVMEKVAKFFHLDPTYFYEYRLRKVLDYINNNRKFLDIVERAMKKYKVEEVHERAEIEEPEEELEVGKKNTRSESTG